MDHIKRLAKHNHVLSQTFGLSCHGLVAKKPDVMVNSDQCLAAFVQQEVWTSLLLLLLLLLQRIPIGVHTSEPQQVLGITRPNKQ